MRLGAGQNFKGIADMSLGRRIVCLGVFMLTATQATAQDLRELRIETFIYTDSKDRPVSENLTLFKDGRVFDFRMDTETHEPVEVTVYDPANKVFKLYDLGSQTQMVMTEEEIIRVLAKVATDPALKGRDPLLFEAHLPGKLQEDFDAGENQITLTSESRRLTYQAQGQPPRNPDMFNAYCDYMDWYTSLNGTDPRKMPPYARKALNKSIREHRIIPEQVELTYSPPGVLERKLKATSRHFVSWTLSRSDQEHLEKVRQLIKFDRVQFAQYLNRDRQTR